MLIYQTNSFVLNRIPQIQRQVEIGTIRLWCFTHVISELGCRIRLEDCYEFEARLG